MTCNQDPLHQRAQQADLLELHGGDRQEAAGQLPGQEGGGSGGPEGQGEEGDKDDIGW